MVIRSIWTAIRNYCHCNFQPQFIQIKYLDILFVTKEVLEIFIFDAEHSQP